jgi:hypothetical protein
MFMTKLLSSLKPKLSNSENLFIEKNYSHEVRISLSYRFKSVKFGHFILPSFSMFDQLIVKELRFSNELYSSPVHDSKVQLDIPIVFNYGKFNLGKALMLVQYERLIPVSFENKFMLFIDVKFEL